MVNLDRRSCALCEHGNKPLVKGGVCAGCFEHGSKTDRPKFKPRKKAIPERLSWIHVGDVGPLTKVHLFGRTKERPDLILGGKK